MLFLFDIDGTILLTGGAGSRALNRVFAVRFGIDGAMDAVRAGGKTDPGIVREVFETRLERAPSVTEIDEILAEYIPLLEEELAVDERFRLMPDVVDTLDYLATDEEVILGIATGNVRAGAKAKLERAALWDRFAFGGYGCDDEDRAELVSRAIERGREHAAHEFSAERIVVVGDTPRDIDAARACGVQVIAVATGHWSKEELRAHEPDELFETLAELPAWHTAQRA